jgi:trans-2,3-dihydro-3-hydroxyanthranilate isomerase
LELAHGHIPLSIADPQHINNSLLYMYQTQPVFNDVYTREQISLALNIPPDDIARTLPIQEISTGLPYIIVPLNNIQAMENIRLSYESLTEMLKSVYKHKTNNPDGYSSSLFFFTKQSYEAGSAYNARMFLIENEKLSEDAATGSANGCLLAYLLTYDKPQVKAVVEQGFQMGRKSYVHLNGALTDGMYHIQVGGYCQLISQGTWYI